MRTYVLSLATAVLAAMGSALPAAGANLVTNPGFETGDLTGWTLAGTDSGPGGNGIYYGVDALDAHSGSYGAYFGPVGGILTLSQTLATTPGGTYTVGFWLAQSPAAPTPYVNSIGVSFGGVNLFGQTGVANNGFAAYTFSGTAAGGSTILQFSFRDDTGFFSLDDVAVTASSGGTAPEPESGVLLVLGGLGLFLVRRGRRA